MNKQVNENITNVDKDTKDPIDTAIVLEIIHLEITPDSDCEEDNLILSLRK